VPKDVLGEHLSGQIELEVVFVKRESGFDEKSEVEEKRSRAGENYIQASEGKSRAKTTIEVEAQWVAIGGLGFTTPARVELCVCRSHEPTESGILDMIWGGAEP
jgi:hypothetical protein